MNILSRILQFFEGLWISIKEAFVFIGTPFDMISAAFDVFLLSIIFYFILRLVRDSRAWQLLKGILLILALGLLSNFVGLTALGFLITRTLSIFAIAFLVIFQPELRRALETVGRSGFRVFTSEESSHEGKTHQLIESIVRACDEMAAKRCGALIVIERSTPLGDLVDQENAVTLDAAVSTAFIKQLFYLGSPLHDGAVLIRNNRVAAARVHIPLSDNYHLRKDFGTRHRAGIGASEIGDTVAIVVSEERGTISICIDGRLFVLDNADALRTQLHRLLIPEEQQKRGRKILHIHRREAGSFQNKKQKLALSITSVCLAFAMWLFVQVTVNPIESKTFTVPLDYREENQLLSRDLEAQYRIENIRVTVRGRKNHLDHLASRQVTAYIDLSDVEDSGTRYLPVDAKVNSNQHTLIESITPSQIMMSIRPSDKPGVEESKQEE